MDTVGPLRFRISARLQREFDVLADGDVGDQIEALEDETDLFAQFAQGCALQSRNVGAVDKHFTAGRAFQQVDGAHQRRFAGSGKADYAEDLAFFHAEAHMLDRFYGATSFVESNRHVVQFDDAHFIPRFV